HARADPYQPAHRRLPDRAALPPSPRPDPGQSAFSGGGAAAGEDRAELKERGGQGGKVARWQGDKVNRRAGCTASPFSFLRVSLPTGRRSPVHPTPCPLSPCHPVTPSPCLACPPQWQPPYPLPAPDLVQHCL